jgi:hypothetical protein
METKKINMNFNSNKNSQQIPPKNLSRSHPPSYKSHFNLCNFNPSSHLAGMWEENRL